MYFPFIVVMSNKQTYSNSIAVMLCVKRKPKKIHISLLLPLDVCMHSYKLTHITFTPVMVTPSSIPHSMVQGINKETPFPAATNTESSIAMHPSVFKVLPYHSLLAVNHLHIGYKAVLVPLPYLQLQGRVFLCLFPYCTMRYTTRGYCNWREGYVRKLITLHVDF